MLSAPKALRRRSVHSGKLERWLGREKIELLADRMRNGGGPGRRWYGHPLPLLDLSRDVSITGDGDFVGEFDRGGFACAIDHLADHAKRLWKRAGRPIYLPEPVLNTGFSGFAGQAGVADFRYMQALFFNKPFPTSSGAGTDGDYISGNMVPPVDNTLSSLGTNAARLSSDTGAPNFNNAQSGKSLHLLGAEMHASAANCALMLIDRIWEANFTWSSGGTSGNPFGSSPTRYQSTTPGDPDFAGGNFMYPVAKTTPTGSANVDITYTNQGGTGGNVVTFAVPAVGYAQGELLAASTSPWFIPLLAGDYGVKDILKVVTDKGLGAGAQAPIVIARPLGCLAFPLAKQFTPFEWFRSRDLAPRVFDNAHISMIKLTPGTACTVIGNVFLGQSDQ